MIPPLIVGCDPSSQQIAFVAPHPSTPTWAFKKIKLPSPYNPGNTAKALKACKAFIQETLLPMAKKGGDKILYIEMPVVARNSYSTIVQAYINGIIQLAFVEAGFEVHIVQNAKWKKAEVGKGNAGKRDIALYVKRMWPKFYFAIHADQDLVDAAAISGYGKKDHAASVQGRKSVQGSRRRRKLAKKGRM